MLELDNIAISLEKIYKELDDKLFIYNKNKLNINNKKLMGFYEKHYIKMLNLIRSHNVLFSKGFVDEACIILRTIHEHVLNFVYICSFEDYNKRIEKLVLWEKYIELLPYTKIEAIKDKVKEEEFNKFFAKHKNKDHWSGLNTYELTQKAFNTINESFRVKMLDRYKKYCLYSHPQLFLYQDANEKDIYCIEDSKTVLADGAFYFMSYIKGLERVLDEVCEKNIDIKLIEKIESICEQLL